MKPLKAAMKENKRYLLVRGKNLKKNIPEAILEFIGMNGMSKCGMSFIKASTDSAIICINREMVDDIRASLSIYPEKMEVAKVSGTLKSLEK